MIIPSPYPWLYTRECSVLGLKQTMFPQNACHRPVFRLNHERLYPGLDILPCIPHFHGLQVY